MTSEPEVLVSDSATELASSVADRTVSVLAAAVAQRGVAHLVVTGGSILEAVLASLGGCRDALDWSAVHVWWGDERYVASDSDDRNDLPALGAFVEPSGLDPATVHRMPASDAGFGDDVEAAADSYAAELREFAPVDEDVPRFDAILLGLGPDGHCASLFPRHPGTRVLDASVIAVHDSPKPPPIRLTLTFPALDAADEIWFVASGDGKADAVARALGGADPVEVPSAGPRGRSRTLWLLDRDAASKLP